MHKKIYFLVVILLLLLCGCSKSSEEGTTVKNKQVSVENTVKEKSQEIIKIYDTSEDNNQQQFCEDESTSTEEITKYVEVRTSVSAEKINKESADTIKVENDNTTFESTLYIEDTTTLSMLEDESTKHVERESYTTESIATSEEIVETITTDADTTEMIKSPDVVEETTSNAVIEYSPDRVCSLATTICQQAGLRKSSDGMDESLANDTISIEEYEMFYPYAGLGYLGVFFETDLSEACTITGRKLSSEQAIAEYLAEIVISEAMGEYFYIECAGVYIHHGIPMYEFRCYR